MFQSLESLFAPEDAALLDTLIDAQPDKDRIRSSLRRNLRDPILKRQRPAQSTPQARSSGSAVSAVSQALTATTQSNGPGSHSVPAPAPNARCGTTRSTMAHRATELSSRSPPSVASRNEDQEPAAARMTRSGCVSSSPPVPSVDVSQVGDSAIDPTLRAHQAATAVDSISSQPSAATESCPLDTTAQPGPIGEDDAPKSPSSSAGVQPVSEATEHHAQSKATQERSAPARATESATEVGATVQSQKADAGTPELYNSDSNEEVVPKHYAQVPNLLTLEQSRNNTAVQPANAQ